MNTDILELFEKKELIKICAPMVRYSKLQFRNLVREYGCDLCFTPMILADSFCKSSKARNNEFTTNMYDTPVITQFAANTTHDFVGAAYLVAPFCNGVDLNCGCPQRWAKQMGVGCALLDKPEVISDIISQCRNHIPKPFTVSVKLRILKDIERTVEICRQLEKAGADFLTVHARTSSQITGDINEECLKLICENVNCPVIANGGLKSFEDCLRIQKYTNCKGVMVANSILSNPTLFSNTSSTTIQCVQKWLNICFNSTLTNETYNFYKSSSVMPTIIEYPPNLTFQCFHHHLVFMLEKLLPRPKRQIFNNLQTFRDVLSFLDDYFHIKPQLISDEEFTKFCVCELDYADRTNKYNELKEKYYLEGDKEENFNYNYCDSDGKYFRNKLQDVVLENDDYGLNNMFIEDQ